MGIGSPVIGTAVEPGAEAGPDTGADTGIEPLGTGPVVEPDAKAGSETVTSPVPALGIV